MARVLHPPLTDFPLALWTMSLVFDIASFWGGTVFVQLAFWNLVGALVIGLFTALTGVRDYTKLGERPNLRRLGVIHAAAALFAFIGFGVSVWFRSGELGAQSTPVAAFVLSAISLPAALVAGWLGGRMVYHHGANVRTVVPRPEAPAVRGRTTAPAAREPVRPVPPPARPREPGPGRPLQP